MHCHKQDVIMKCRFSMANGWVHVADYVCFECDVVHLLDEYANKYMRMGMAILKIVIWEVNRCCYGRRFSFYGFAFVSP